MSLCIAAKDRPVPSSILKYILTIYRFMRSTLMRAGSLSFALVLLLGSFPLPADAQSSRSSSSRSSSRDARFEDFGGRISSSANRAIRNLDRDSVLLLPIPVLMGVSVGNLSRNFGDPRDGGDREHQGLDIMAPRGAYVVSPTDAVVTGVGNGSSAGRYVYTANPGGERFAYMHLDTVAVRAGDVLEPGDLIGTVGNTGNASGGAPHLHFEIRENNRRVTDPYPRLMREFTTEERGRALAKIVQYANDEEAEALRVATSYRSVLLAARAAGVEFPRELEDVLGPVLPTATFVAGAVPFTRDLTLGSTGPDVASLQSFLIAENAGLAAQALLEAGATGYFGPITQRALSEYQARAGIVPAAGYFGPITRARMLAVM